METGGVVGAGGEGTSGFGVQKMDSCGTETTGAASSQEAHLIAFPSLRPAQVQTCLPQPNKAAGSPTGHQGWHRGLCGWV